MLDATSITNLNLKAVTDADRTQTISFEVSEDLSVSLNDLREKLDEVDPKKPGQQRYEAARKLGCGAAVAKGAKYRSLTPERVFIPNTEIRRLSDGIRIPYLKTTIPNVPEEMNIKAVLFLREEGAWVGQLEVKMQAA
jgi:hypothetical protein